MKTPDTFTVLCVDDEKNILSSLKRLLFREDYELLFATSGAEGLELLKKHSVQVVISDMKMPNMNGAEFLEQVANTYPDTYRMILSGFADLGATIDAVNKGRIHRFLQKPWDNDQLKKAIDGGLEHVRLKLQNEQLQRKLSAQNQQLEQFNEQLEKKVALRTKQIHVALKKMNQQHRSLEKVLYNMININPKLDGSFARNVSDLCRRLAKKLKLEEAQERAVGLAGAFCEMGLMGIDPFLYSKPFNELNFEQQLEFTKQVEATKMILAPAEHLHDVSNILSHQFLPFAGREGSDEPIYDSICEGGRILKVARDYWSLAQQKTQRVAMSHSQILSHMKKSKGSKYDPVVIEALFGIDEKLFETIAHTGLKSEDLAPGLILNKNLYTPDHLLILPEGHQFTEASIERLKQIEKTKEITFVIDATKNEKGEQ